MAMPTARKSPTKMVPKIEKPMTDTPDGKAAERVIDAVAVASVLILGIIPGPVSAASDQNTPAAAVNGLAWKSAIPDDCPFERSPTLTGIFFTGRHSGYHCGDPFYPSWASDGNLYSPWTAAARTKKLGAPDGIRPSDKKEQPENVTPKEFESEQEDDH